MNDSSASQLKNSALRQWPLWLRWLVVLTPAVLLFALIKVYRVNVPFLDDWMFVYMFEKEQTGSLTLHDFFLVQMEHRMAFVRGVIMLAHWGWPTDYTVQMFFSWVLLALTYLNIGVMLKKTVGGKFQDWWWLLVLAGLAVFSPLHYRVVLWAMMFQVAALGFFLSTSIVVLMSRLPLWLRWIIWVLCASCATQCFASGLLVWVLPLPLVFWGGTFPTKKGKIIFTVLWAICFVVTAKLYFTDLKNEVDAAFSYKEGGDEKSLDSDMKQFFTNPAHSVPYVLRFVGSLLSRGTSFGQMDASLAFGALMVTILIGSGVYWLWNFKREELRKNLLPWMLFGAYSVGTGCMVAMGRSWASKTGDNALAARYTVHLVPLVVASAVLVWLIARDLRQRRPQWSVGITKGLLISAVAMFCLQIVSWSYGLRMMQMWHSSRLRGMVDTMFVNTNVPVDYSVPVGPDLARRANALGLLKPPLLTSTALSQFRTTHKYLNENTAQLSSLVIETDGAANKRIVARGFACLAGRDRVADGIFFTIRAQGSPDWTIFRVGQVQGLPIYLMDSISRDTQFAHTKGHLGQEPLSSFETVIDLTTQPQGVYEIMAWAYDAERKAVMPMPGCFLVDTKNGSPIIKRLESDIKISSQ